MSDEKSRVESDADLFDYSMSFLRELLLEVIKKRRVVSQREATLFALNILSSFLCESASTRCRVPVGLLEAVLEVIGLFDADCTKFPGFYGPRERTALKEIQERMRTLREMGVMGSRGLDGDRDVQVRIFHYRL